MSVCYSKRYQEIPDVVERYSMEIFVYFKVIFTQIFYILANAKVVFFMLDEKV